MSPQISELTDLYIFGAGGFGREVAWLAEETVPPHVRLHFLIDRGVESPPIINGVDVSCLQEVETTATSGYVVAVGDPVARRAIVTRCEAHGLMPVTLIHRDVKSSRYVQVGSGSIVCARTVLTVQVNLGRHVHVNLACTIGHDVFIGDFVTLSPGVHVSGNVHIHEGAFIGTGASIINGTSDAPLVIGSGATVAAGACVTRTVESAALVAGVPAVRKR